MSKDDAVALRKDDYHEESVVTPECWFKATHEEAKLLEAQYIEKYILTFSYMEHFLEHIKSLDARRVEWYPNLWTFSLNGERCGLLVCPIGAPATVGRLEDAIYLGGDEFLLTGGVGVLQEDIPWGGFILPTAGIRDEGTSYHYLSPEEQVTPSPSMLEKAKEVCERAEVPYASGKVWTTDAPYRETPTRVKAFRKKGAICVDMEATACFAVAKYRNVQLGAIFYGGDYVGDRKWAYRVDEAAKDAVMETLFSLVCEVLQG